MYQDETLICEDCGKEFVFSVGEQEFYAEKGFFKPIEGKEIYCKDCYAKRQAQEV